jgi:uncharacterized protein with GYD domain
LFIEFVMSTYILLWNWTHQGIHNAKGAPNRYESFKSELEKAGGKSINAYYTFGEHDGVVIFEAPDDEAVMKIMVSTASQGNIRTKTLKALPHTEGARIMGSL